MTKKTLLNPAPLFGTMVAFMAIKTVIELKQEREAILAQAEAILDVIDTDGSTMSPEQEAKYNAAVDRAAQLNIEIERRMKLEAVQVPNFAETAPRAGGFGSLSNRPDDTDVHATIRPTANGPRIEIPRSYGRLRVFDRSPQGNEEAYRCGMWIAATLYNHAPAMDWCRQNGLGVRAALSGGVNTAGGVLVPEEMDRAIIKLVEEYGLFRRSCRNTPMTTDTVNRPRRTGGLTAYYVGENTEGTESDAAWDNVALMAKKLMVLTRMSSELSEDAIVDMADEMAEEMGMAFALKEDQSGFIGDGTSTYGGITGVLVKALSASHTMAKVAAASTHDTFAELDADDLLKLMSAIPQYAKRGAAWYCSPTAQELVFNAIKIAGGGNTRDMLAEADRPRFLGYPINVTDIMADSATTTYNGTVMLAFGNLSLAATLGNRRGIRIAFSDQKYWTEDQIGIKGTMRHDINVHDLGSTTVKSPFAVLVGTT